MVGDCLPTCYGSAVRQVMLVTVESSRDFLSDRCRSHCREAGGLSVRVGDLAVKKWYHT